MFPVVATRIVPFSQLLVPSKPRLEPRTNRRPFVVQNTVVNRVSEPPIVRHHVAPEDTFFNRAQSKHCIPRLLIQNIGLELDSHAVPHIERVAKHQIFRFGIDVSPLKMR